jgi:hypothetical protein
LKIFSSDWGERRKRDDEQKNKTPLRDVLFFLFGVTQLQIHKKAKAGLLGSTIR